ncbi:MAG: hypothetical protein OXU94_01010 [Gammaproteobacteria bacterium]|nr:hypothetical protein [Gammaproteobacteria bacterium]
MFRLFKWLLFIAALPLLALAAVAAVLEFSDDRWAKQLLADAVRHQSGAELAIDGDLSLSLSLSPALRAENVRLRDARGLFAFRAGDLAVGAELRPLFSGDGVVFFLDTAAPELRTALAPAVAAAASASGTQRGWPVPLDKIRARDGTLIVTVGGRERTVHLGSVRIVPAAEGGAMKVTALGNVGSAALTVRGTVPDRARLNAGGGRVNLTASLGGTRLTITGATGDPQTLHGLALKTELSNLSLGAALSLAGAPAWIRGVHEEEHRKSARADIAFTVNGAQNELHVDDVTVDSDSGLLTLKVRGAAKNLLSERRVELSAELAVPSVAEFFLGDKETAPADGALSASAAFTGGRGVYTVKLERATVRGGIGEVSASGEMRDVWTGGGWSGGASDFSLRAEFPDIAPVGALFGARLPAGPFSGEAVLRERGPLSSLENIRANLRSEYFSGELRGRVRDLVTWSGVDFALDAGLSTDRGSALEKLLPGFVPRVGKFSLHAKLTSDGDAEGAPLRLHAEAVTADRKNTASMDGVIGDLRSLRGLSLSVNSRLARVGKIPVWPAYWPAVKTVRASGILFGGGAGLAMREVDVRLDGAGFRARARGTVNALVTASPELNLNLQLSADHLTTLPLPQARILPKMGPFTLGGRLMLNDDGAPALLGIKADAGKGRHVLRISGDVRRIANPTLFDLRAEGGLPNMNSLARYEMLRPFTGHAARLRLQMEKMPGVFRIKDSVLSFDKNQVRGDLTLRQPQKRNAKSLLSGRLRIRELNSASWSRGGDDGKTFFPRRAIPWENLRRNDLDLAVEVDKLVLRDVVFDRARTRLRSRGAKIDMAPIRAAIGGKAVSAEVHADFDRGRRAPPLVKLRATAAGIQSSSINGSAGTAENPDSKTDFDLRISGRGRSIAGIAARASGRFYFGVTDARVATGLLHLFGADILTQIADLVIPVKRRRSNVECAVMRFDISSGVARADKSIAMRTDRVTISGDGEVNLRDETLAIRVKTKAHTGFGLSTGLATNLIKIGGTILGPRLVTSPKNLLSTTANLGVAVVTSGWSLISQGLWNRLSTDRDLCKEVLAYRRGLGE